MSRSSDLFFLSGFVLPSDFDIRISDLRRTPRYYFAAPTRDLGESLCESLTLRAVTRMPAATVAAVVRVVHVLAQPPDFGVSRDLAVVLAGAILSKLARRLCR